MHSLEEAQEIARNIITRGIGVNDNQALALSDETLATLGN
jgi:S-ribosylhomocysteine lyase